MPNQAVKLLISGRVQGVWYRASTAEKAQALGVVGWVRNLADGRVQAHVQGPAEAVEALVAWCEDGPPMARVDSVSCSDASVDEYASFEVRRGRFSAGDE